MNREAELLSVCNTLLEIVDKIESGTSVDKKWLQSNLQELEQIVQADSVFSKYVASVGYRAKSRQEEKSIRQFANTLGAIKNLMTMVFELENLPTTLTDNENRRKIIEDLELRKLRAEVEKMEAEAKIYKRQVDD